MIKTKKLFHLRGNSNTGSIELKDGSFLRLDGFNLNTGSQAIISNEHNFIVTNDTGRLIRSVATTNPVLFPVGYDTSSYTPVTITNTGTTDIFSVRVDTGVTNVGIPVTGGVIDRTWLIADSSNGSSHSTIALQWNVGDELTGFNRASCYVSQNHGCDPPPNCVDSYYDISPGTASTGIGPFSQFRNTISSPTKFIVRSSPDTFMMVRSGDWSDLNNWRNGLVPSRNISQGMIIVIDPDPSTGNECYINGDIDLSPEGKLIIKPGMIFTVRRQ